ncbi:50S ribosomal protein L4 [Candidatus Borrarchaeum sp.]|uniref:50S ribosomal protein L4 n=1 Tax=Candidatus Borrarchaeum sp. TaxID=2846742 RepID=UPI00258081F6|nr:50S ribosomal protein L4 [Candidatus Borrarchaeum sp.]
MNIPEKGIVYDLDGTIKEEITLPSIFFTPFRPDLIQRAVIAAITARIQPYGVNKKAGQRTSAESMGVGRGIARVPRIKGSRHHAGSRGAFVPMAVGGRQAHPPKPEKIHVERINKNERRFALRSAIAATANKILVRKRGHSIEMISKFPIILTDEFQLLTKTSETKSVFEKLGIWTDVIRAKSGKKIRSGKGKLRGRKYKKPKGPLIVISEDNGIIKAARNHPGIDIIHVNNLNTESLAPGGHPGRLTIWVKSAIEYLAKQMA